MSEQTMTLVEAAAFLKMHPKTLVTYWRKGDVPGRKLGQQYRFLLSDLVRFVHGGSNRNPS